MFIDCFYCFFYELPVSFAHFSIRILILMGRMTFLKNKDSILSCVKWFSWLLIFLLNLFLVLFYHAQHLNFCVVKCINLFLHRFCLYVLLRNIISILRLYKYSLKMCLVIFMALFLTFNSLIHLVLNFCIKHIEVQWSVTDDVNFKSVSPRLSIDSL